MKGDSGECRAARELEVGTEENWSQKIFDDPGIFVELPLVNQMRPRIKAWREAGYPGCTGITNRLLQHWLDSEQRDSNRRFFFCQLEAIETLIWLTEASASERIGIDVPPTADPSPGFVPKWPPGLARPS